MKLLNWLFRRRKPQWKRNFDLTPAQRRDRSRKAAATRYANHREKVRATTAALRGEG